MAGRLKPRMSLQTLEARVALRADQSAAATAAGSSSSSSRRAADYLVGTALEEAERSAEELEIVWPLQRLDRGDAQQTSTQNGQDTKGKAREEKPVEGVQDWTALEALL